MWNDSSHRGISREKAIDKPPRSLFRGTNAGGVTEYYVRSIAALPYWSNSH